jgi:cell division protein FtsZ
VLRQGVQGISDIITIPGIINRDFADVKTTMAGMGHAVMGTAIRSGENRAIEAAQAAMASPLLEAGAIDGARGILINITGSSSLKLTEVNQASSLIQAAAHEDANIIFGAVLDEKMGEEVKITVIATGFRGELPERRARMLSVEEPHVVSSPVESTPVPTVPLEVPPSTQPENIWLLEPAPAPVAEPAPVPEPVPVLEPVPAPAPAPPRFLSQEEEVEPLAVEMAVVNHVVEPVAFSALAPVENISYDVPPPATESTIFEPEPVAARPRFAELAEEPVFAPMPREEEPVPVAEARGPATLDDYLAQPATTLFRESDEEAQPDLEKPTFLRRRWL